MVGGWEIRVPPREPDGFPYQSIFSGPAREHRNGAIRLRMGADGREVADDAEILLEAHDTSGSHRRIIFQGTYR